jgi:hypothetical protein
MAFPFEIHRIPFSALCPVADGLGSSGDLKISTCSYSFLFTVFYYMYTVAMYSFENHCCGERNAV